MIEGMSCPHCAGNVESALRQVTGVRTVKVDLSRKKAMVEADDSVSDAQLKNVVEELGYDVKAIKNP